MARHDLQFLKTFFSEQRSIDEKTIEATMSECGNDRETAFDRLMSKIYTNQVPSQQITSSSRVSKRKRADFEND